MPHQPSHTIGVGVFVMKGDEILVGLRGRKCGRGVGQLALPGGHVDPGETVIEAAVREVYEETGVRAVPLANQTPFTVPGCLAVTDHADLTQQVDGNLVAHLSAWVLLLYASGSPHVREAGKAEWWDWQTPGRVLDTLEAWVTGSPQYYWTPGPLWTKVLAPHFPNAALWTKYADR